jgi:cytochrome c peroxidase
MTQRRLWTAGVAALACAVLVTSLAGAADPPGKKTSSYAPVAIDEDFATVMARMQAAKPAIEKRQADLLGQRYDLSTGRPRGRPQEFRHRIDTPSLRGVNIQRLLGFKSVEDFTEFEQRAAYFDGDPVIATKKGVNILERGSQVHDMAEFQELLNGRMASADGPIKTFPLRGIKDSPPYLHDGRLLTLEDTVEFFNVVTGVKLTDEEKVDLVAFMRQL